METEYSYKRLLRFFIQFISPYWLRFSLATIFSALSSALSLYNAFAVASIVNFVISYKVGQSLNELYTILIIWFLSINIKFLATFISREFGMPMAEMAAKDAEIYAIQHLSRLDISWHEQESS